ncbi:hypothetical protein HYU72_01495 [Candidatus Berkelbacteria bacterium]|nr:hypothetical protein [Candidatus Berkelbacteria bacterium]
MNQNLDLQEQMFVRMISGKGYLEEAKNYGLEQLLAWPEHTSCRLAVEAIVSNTSDSPLSPLAQKWVGQQKKTYS